MKALPVQPHLLRCGADLDRLVRRIAVEAAPVWSGDRPALTLCLHGCQHPGAPCAEAVFLGAAGELLPRLGLSARRLRRGERDCQWLFYDPERLAARLAEPDAAALLRSRGWPTEPSAALDRLAAGFVSSPGACPPEVGVFLGYPVRDVAGFIERPAEALPLRGALWRVFAPAAESLRLMARVRSARNRALHLLALESDALRAVSMLRRSLAAG
ncbi:MAG: DUF3793 family protein [Kiritimatiellae bacterium]|nr:DUF3793 family protein [Kiritimatiellia bacterium]